MGEQPGLRRPLPDERAAARARALRNETRHRRLAAVAAGPAGLGVAAAVGLAALAARHASPADVSPVTPAGAWQPAWTWSVAAAVALWAVGLLLLRVGGRLRVALALAVVIQALPLAAPLLLSKDAYLYWGEARVVTAHHASPYVSTPADYPHDPALPYVSEEWRTSVAPYGPAWTALALAPAAAAGGSAHSAELGYRLLALAGVLATVLLVAWTTRSPFAVAIVGWSPLVALHFAGGGHGDAWLVLLLALAVLFRTRAAGAAAWPLAAAMKPVPLVLLPLDLAASRVRRDRRFWAALAGTAVAVLAASGALWGFGWVRASLVGVHGVSPLGGVHWLMEAGLPHRYAVVAAGLVFCAVYLLLLRSAWRTGRARHSLATSALCLTTSLLRPWYGIWPLALAAVEDDAPAALAAVALSAYLLFGDAVQL